MLRDETVMTLAEAAATLPRLNGRKPHASTIWRWARKGIGGVKLETRRIGARFVTSTEALERFTQQLAEIELPEACATTAPRSRTDSQRHRAVKQAEQTLTGAGIL